MATRQDSEDPYAVLGVARTATADEIRAAFRARAKALHPDKNRRSDTRADFQRLREAYAVLGRPELRQRYDLHEPGTPPPAAADRPSGTSPRPAPKPRRDYRYWGLVLPVVVLALLAFGLHALATRPPAGPDYEVADLEREIEAAIPRHALGFLAPPPEPAEIEISGKGGKRFLVPRADHRRLTAIYHRLVDESRSLHQRQQELDARRNALEKERATLATAQVGVVVDFGIKVNAFNADGAEFRRLFELHAAEVEGYFKEIERLAVTER
jgi:curved DNA-binding protein CbpA